MIKDMKFKHSVYEAQVTDSNGQRLRFYIAGDYTSLTAMNELRRLYPVVAGYNERLVIKIC